MSSLGTAITGINAAQIGLLTTEHNIANASTPGYTRQRIIQTNSIPMFTGAGFIGQGTRVTTIERQYNAFLVAQVNSAQTNASELEKYASEIAQIDNILADPSAGLSPALQDFFRGVQQVVASPASLPARQAMISSAQALAARFQGIESRLAEIYEGVDSQITTAVEEINSIAQQIGELNQRIIVAEAAVNQPANDLLDQRDQLVAELNKRIRVEVVNDPSGAFNVFIGNGQQLVVGPKVSSLGVMTDPLDSTRISIGINNSGSTVLLPETMITGGELGGLVRFRREGLDAAANQLGNVAASLTLTFNAQHALGQDLLGQIDGDAGFAADFFTPLTPGVRASSTNTSGTVVSAAYVAPTESASGFFTHLTSSDYQLTAAGGGNFTLRRLSDNKTWGPAVAGPTPPAAFIPGSLNSILANPADPAYEPQGFTVSVAGAALAGESFLIQPTRDVARNFRLNETIAADPRLIAAAGPLRAQPAATNVGSGKVLSTSVGEGYLASAGGGLPITLTYDAATSSFAGFPPNTSVTLSNAGALNGTYAIAALGTQVPYVTGATIRIDDPAAPPATVANAITLQISGLPANNDRFVVERNSQGVSDSRNMLKLGELQTQNTMAGQTTTFQGAYAALVSDTGNRSRATNVTLAAQTNLLEQAQAAREASAGVNLDEEAANLLRFQQAYQAAAKSLDVVSRLFDTLLGIGG